MSIILRRRYQRADIGGTRFLFLATLRQHGRDDPVYIEENEVMRVLETKSGARLARVGVMSGELKEAALRFAGLTSEDLE